MCGRYTLSLSVGEIWDELDLEGEPGEDIWSQGPETNLAPRFNIAPSQAVPVVTDKSPSKLVMLRWGLIPHWAKDTKVGYRMLNARGETVAAKPAFRDSFKKRRCLVIADGFYEWKKEGEGKKAPKTPYYARPEGGGVMAFAGLWSSWRAKTTGAAGSVDSVDSAGTSDEVQPVEQVISCTIVTTDAAGVMADVHHRMPVILEGEARRRWLDPGAGPDELNALLLPRVPALEAYPIQTLVNSVRNDGPELIVPAPADEDGAGSAPERILVD